MVDGDPCTITHFEHCKPGKGNQFTRTKLKNLITGSNLEKTFKSGKKFEAPDIYYQDIDFLYKDDAFHFMDSSTYEQFSLPKSVLGESEKYLLENMKVKACVYNDRVISIELPSTVLLKVTFTEPGHKGNTVTAATKPATLETGLSVQVPLHIKEGDILKIDTKEGSYMERVQSK